MSNITDTRTCQIIVGSKIRAIGGIAGASAIQVVLLALLSLLLARVLPVEDFGITRVVTAYMVVLTMFGHMCLHDAVSTFVARVETVEEKSAYVMAGSKLVLISSVMIVLVFEVLVLNAPWWTGRLRNALASVMLFLPLVTLTLVYTSVLQSIGSYKKLSVAVLLGGVIPLICMVPPSAGWGLTGWIFGRGVSYFLLLVCGVILTKEFFVATWPSQTYSTLIGFSRVQLVSGILSMGMQSADILILERLGASLSDIALYGLAALFARSVLFVPGAMGRVYFREIAEGSSRGDYTKPAYHLLGSVVGICVTLAVIMATCVPAIIRFFYGEEYSSSIPILEVMCVGIVFNGLWSALSTINIAINRPSFAVAISLSGFAMSLVLLVLLVPSHGTIGAAWAMNAAYIVGSCVGLWLIYGEHQRRNLL
jgi:O-antigen/teichoic acid export membrane protein